MKNIPKYLKISLVLITLAFSLALEAKEMIPVEDLARVWEGPVVPKGWTVVSQPVKGDYAIILQPDTGERDYLSFMVSWDEVQPRMMVSSGFPYKEALLEFFSFFIQKEDQHVLYGRYRVMHYRGQLPLYVSEMGSIILFKFDPKDSTHSLLDENSVEELFSKNDTPLQRPQNIPLEEIQRKTWRFGGMQFRDRLDQFLVEIPEFPLSKKVQFFGEEISLEDLKIENLSFRFTDTPVIQNGNPTDKKVIEILGLPQNLKERLTANYLYMPKSCSFILNLGFDGIFIQEFSLVLDFNENELILKLVSEPLVPKMADPERFQISHALRLKQQ